MVSIRRKQRRRRRRTISASAATWRISMVVFIRGRSGMIWSSVPTVRACLESR
ncbi:hypothetical protein GDI0011 [Gluconacetobacter diazotrophicus PA1 5]|uniref:Uncharacterized protein n=1 Tax=Gluconacetobacter diazotrophicus (strain ATCC 49037 / DSM 5601 / CCUG 37298 / CIP 103539 / LMG 7603 / PAl5) TaxID=272568 RepID=A9GZF7_GLUDA|nr:hypothetical protein GDI0011 [Gluconacetobacter diazotrophicus PA1 5]